MKNQVLKIEELDNYIGKYIWMIDVNRGFGGERKLKRVDHKNRKIWDETGSYLRFEDMNTKMEVYGERPDCFDEMMSGVMG